MRKRRIAAVLAVACAAVLTVAGLYAYFSDEEASKNKFTIGHNTITPVEKFDPPDELKTGENIYKKDVAIQNEIDSVPCYVRVAVEFSDEDIARNSGFLPNSGTTYYSAMLDGVEGITTADGTVDKTGAVTKINPDAFIKHMGDDWVYISMASDSELGGYYYYTKVLQPGTITSSLFKGVNTYFSSKRYIKDYDIFVYAESVQTLNKNGYEFVDKDTGDKEAWKQAWREFVTHGTNGTGGN